MSAKTGVSPKYFNYFRVKGVDLLLLHFLCDILVSDGDNFINTNTNYFPPHRVEDFCSDLYSNLYGLQTKNNESKLTDIDRNYNINKL